MGYLLAIGVSAGILAAIFVHVAFFTSLAATLAPVAWVTYAAIACYFAVGGKVQGMVKSMLANITGVLWGAAILYGATQVLFPAGLSIQLSFFIATLVIVIIMCAQAKIGLLSFIPGTFIGAAMAFGTEGMNDKVWPYGNIVGCIIAIIIGGLLGLAMDKGGALIFKMFSKPTKEA